MNVVEHSSEPAIRSEADLFSYPPTDATVDHSFFSEYKPTVNIRDSDTKIEFRIVGNSNQYLDFNQSFLYCVVKVVNEDGTKLGKDVNVGTTNLLLHSLFSQCDVFVSNELVSTTNNCYAYKAYMETMLSHGTDYLDTQGMCAMYFQDTDGGSISANNEGLVKRKNAIANSQPVELVGKLKFDLANQHRYILNDTNVVISLTRQTDRFCLKTWTKPADPPIIPKLQFLDASFFVCKQALYPSLIIAHQRFLETQNAKYPAKKTGVKFFMIPNGNSTFIEENMFNGRKLPERIVLGLVPSKAFNGDYGENPFQFLDYGLSYLALSVNGFPTPMKPLTLNFQKQQSLLPYYMLFSGLGIANQDHGLPINFDEFKNGSTLFAFNLRPQGLAETPLALQKDGSVKLELNFKKPISQALHCVVYYEETQILEIDKYRKVIQH